MLPVLFQEILKGCFANLSLLFLTDRSKVEGIIRKLLQKRKHVQKREEEEVTRIFTEPLKFRLQLHPIIVSPVYKNLCFFVNIFILKAYGFPWLCSANVQTLPFRNK